jgi:hypothetical protein
MVLPPIELDPSGPLGTAKIMILEEIYNAS